MTAREELVDRFGIRGWIDDPFLGPVIPAEFLQRSPVAPGDPRWTTIDIAHTVTAGHRQVEELTYTPADGTPAVPVAIVWDDSTTDRTARVYYNKGLIGGLGADRVRPPIIPVDPDLRLHPAMATYGQALRSADGAALRSVLHPTFRTRRPNGEYLEGGDVRDEFIDGLVSIGGVPLEYLISTDDGSRAANEFTSWRHPAHAGLGVYERSPDGLLTEFRSYEGPVYPRPGTSW